MTLLLLLAFTGQTMATAAMSCDHTQMIQNSHDVIMAEMVMGTGEVLIEANHSDPDIVHLHHNMDETHQPQNTHEQTDCCKTMGHCLLGGCALAAASSGITFLLTQHDSTLEDFYLGVTPTPLVSSLYRPPIFC